MNRPRGPSLRLVIGTDRLLVCHRDELARQPPDDYDLCTPTQAQHLLRRALSPPSRQRCVAQLASLLRVNSHAPEQLDARLDQAIRGSFSELVVLRERRRLTSNRASDAELPPSVSAARGLLTDATTGPVSEIVEDQAWIECRLVDELGEPVSGIAYALELPDGRRVEGRTDRAGLLRLDGIPAGACSLTFTQLEADAWEAN